MHDIPPCGRDIRLTSLLKQNCLSYKGQVLVTHSRISHLLIKLQITLAIQCLFVIFFIALSICNEETQIIPSLSSIV